MCISVYRKQLNTLIKEEFHKITLMVFKHFKKIFDHANHGVEECNVGDMRLFTCSQTLEFVFCCFVGQIAVLLI